MIKQILMTVPEYAKLKGKSKAQIYLDIRTGKIPKDKVVKVKVREDYRILVEISE